MNKEVKKKTLMECRWCDYQSCRGKLKKLSKRPCKHYRKYLNEFGSSIRRLISKRELDKQIQDED